MSTKGYVVRGKDADAGDTLWAYDPQIRTAATETRVDASLLETPSDALAASVALSDHCKDVTILAVFEDGSETPLPNYEEALAEIERLSRSEAACVREALEQVGVARAERDEARAEIARLKADLLLLGALKSEEVAPVIERFREAFGADVPQAPSGKRALTFERAIQIGEKVRGLYPSEAAAVLLAEFGEPAKVDPPVRHARHDRHCMIGGGVGCSREPGCEVEP